MKNLIAALEDNDDPIISPAGSCTYAVKSYPTYLADEPEWASRAAKVAARMQDLTSFIVNKLGVVDVGASLQGRAVYHLDWPPESPDNHLFKIALIRLLDLGHWRADD